MSFKRDLSTGQRGEEYILTVYPFLKRADGRTHDFITPSGKLVEHKFDQTKYTNIFLEFISNGTKQSPGGPFQSMLNGVTYFLYTFERDKKTYCFRVVDIVWFLMLNKEKYTKKVVPNKGYDTIGYAIPIKDIEHLQIDFYKEIV